MRCQSIVPLLLYDTFQAWPLTPVRKFSTLIKILVSRAKRLLCKSFQQARHITQFLRQPRNDLPSAIKQITQGITLTVNPLTLPIAPIIRL